MSDLIREDILQKLIQIAEERHRDLNDFLTDVVMQYQTETVPSDEVDEENPPPGTLAELAASARKAKIRSDKPVTTSRDSREILHTEYAEHIKKHMGDRDDQPR